MQQLIGISLMLVALGAILWVHMRDRCRRNPLYDPRSRTEEGRNGLRQDRKKVLG